MSRPSGRSTGLANWSPGVDGGGLRGQGPVPELVRIKFAGPAGVSDPQHAILEFQSQVPGSPWGDVPGWG